MSGGQTKVHDEMLPRSDGPPPYGGAPHSVFARRARVAITSQAPFDSEPLPLTCHRPRRDILTEITRGRATIPYRLRFGLVYFTGRFLGSIFVKPVPFLSSRI
jgi:hypothetical protein